MMKRVLGIAVALLVALGAGWVWGAWGRSDTHRALRIAELRNGLLEGRAAVLDARLDIYSVNFGEASRHLETARGQCVLVSWGWCIAVSITPRTLTRPKLAPLELSVKDQQTVNVPVWAGVGAIVIGGALLLVGGRKPWSRLPRRAPRAAR